MSKEMWQNLDIADGEMHRALVAIQMTTLDWPRSGSFFSSAQPEAA